MKKKSNTYSKRVMSLLLAFLMLVTTVSGVSLTSYASDRYDPRIIETNVTKIEDYIYANGYRNSNGEYSIQKTMYSDDFEYLYIIKNDTTYDCLHFSYYVSEQGAENEFLRIDMYYQDDCVYFNMWTTDDEYSTVGAHSYTDAMFHHQLKPSTIYIDKNESTMSNSDALQLFDYAMADAFDGWNYFLNTEMGLNLGAIGYFAYCTNHKFKTTTTKATCTSNGSARTVCQICGDLTEKTIAKVSNVKLSTTKYTYDGKAKSPTLTVKDSAGKALVKGTDYTVSVPSGRKSIGKYSYKITFKGKYSGTKTVSFNIVPKTTSIISLTPASKGFTVKWKKQATQTTGYQVQIATDSNFKKGVKSYTVSKNTTTSKKITKLSGKKKYYVRVRTYKTVSGTKYYSSWSAKKNVTTK